MGLLELLAVAPDLDTIRRQCVGFVCIGLRLTVLFVVSLRGQSPSFYRKRHGWQRHGQSRKWWLCF